MAVPHDDLLCRFVRPEDWSTREARPRPGAFKQPRLSVWHCNKLHRRGVQLDELRIEHLGGYGQAHHSAGDYVAYARQSSLEVQVAWRPDDEYVAEPWRQWNYAHVQVEATSGPEQFSPLYRRLLATSCRHSVPPDSDSVR